MNGTPDGEGEKHGRVIGEMQKNRADGDGGGGNGIKARDWKSCEKWILEMNPHLQRIKENWLHSLLSKFRSFVAARVRCVSEDMWSFHPSSFVYKEGKGPIHC